MTALALALAVVLAQAAPAAPTGGPMAADLVVIAQKVITLVDPEPTPAPTAVAMQGGRIVFVGAEAGAQAFIGPATRVLRRPDAVVVPGLVDSHAHLTNLGRTRTRLDLRETASPEAVAALVAAAPAGTGWIQGRGWDQNDWPIKEFPDHATLDAVSGERPVALTRIDGHALWVNRAALQAAKITRATPDPAGGRIVRRPDGEPSGVLVDTAMDAVLAAIPPPTPEQTRAAVLAGVEACHRVGLTGVHDAGTGAQELAALTALDAEGKLPLRVYAMLWGDDPAIDALVAPGPRAGRMLTVRAVKLFADGALGSRGAWLKAPYTDAPDTQGIPITHGEALRARVRQYADAGYQVGVHAIGDAAVADVLDAFAAAPGPDRRFRVEHAQIVSPDDQARMAALGVVAMVQPTHATSDMPWAEARLGPVRVRHAYAWRSLRRAGVRLSLGSDFPVERPDPVAGLYAAVTRMDAAGQPAGGWYPEEALTAREALAGFTVDAAFAGFAEARRGRVAVGQDADLTLLSADPLGVAPEKIKEIKPVGVVVDGRLAWPEGP